MTDLEGPIFGLDDADLANPGEVFTAQWPVYNISDGEAGPLMSELSQLWLDEVRRRGYKPADALHPYTTDWIDPQPWQPPSFPPMIRISGRVKPA